MPADRRRAAGTGTVPRGLRQISLRGAIVILPLLLLTACASAPDWANPGKIFDDDSPPASRHVDPDAPIPNLSSVPDRPRRVSSRDSRDEIQAALTADLKAGDQVLAGDSLEDKAEKTGKNAASARSEIVAVVYFDSGSAALGASARNVLAEVAKLQLRDGGRLRVVGHASHGGVAGDDAAVEGANQRMSEARAEEVARTLLAYGVAPADLFYAAVGDKAPLYEEATASGQAGNRRAEIFLETAPQAK